MSFNAMVGGVDQYMQEYFEFPKFCDKVLEAFRRDRFISKRDLNRDFFRKMRQGFELDRVVDQLKKQGHIRTAHRASRGGGIAAEGWQIVEE